jgi:uncharacterized protein (TIGR01777 family)
MKIGITGAGGFIGTRIVALALERGHAVIGFTRNPSRGIAGCGEVRRFSPDETPDITGCGAIIHLAGEPVFGLWTAEKRRRIRDSRVLGTRHLVDAILAAEDPPRVLVSGSATGYYGNTGEKEADENSSAGRGFLAEVTQAWEAEALRARSRNVRVVLLRTSVVLGSAGGALQAMLPLFRAGLGGKLGSGQQWMAWIHLDDEAALALHAVENEGIGGPLNAAAPQPCRNEDFTRTLARVLRRPALFAAPAFLLKTVLGEFSRELLDSKRIAAKRAAAAGFTFRFPSLDEALGEIIARQNGE